MQRFGMVLKVRPGRLAAYRRLHRAVWPGIRRMIRRCHIRNYTIFFKDGYLFSYYEYTGRNYRRDMARMAADPLTQRWWALCKPCQQPLRTRAPGEWWACMEPVFRLD